MVSRPSYLLKVALLTGQKRERWAYNFFSAQHYLGEAKLNATLKQYVAAVAFQQPPYTNSPEFIGYLRRARFAAALPHRCL